MADSKAPRASVRLLALLGAVAVLVFSLDWIVKELSLEHLVEGRSVPVLGEFFQLTLVFNPGAAFSIGDGATWIFSIIASATVVFIAVFARRIRSLPWTLVFGTLLGGVCGNLFDRLFREPGFGRGHVVDMFHLQPIPGIFNVADVFIVSSMCLFVLLTILGIGLDGSRDAGKGEKAESDADAESEAEVVDEAETDAPAATPAKPKVAAAKDPVKAPAKPRTRAAKPVVEAPED